MDTTQIYEQVQTHYGSLARGTNSDHSSLVARAFGYSEAELSSIPTAANLGLSCGNPLAIATLRENETVIDLGSGAGFDAFLAAKRVGLQGRVIGVDMNKDMLASARKNQSTHAGASNVSFIEANINSIPIDDSAADCIISNCVINLVPESDKQAVFNEMFRLLKPGGRVAISDILARKPLPTKVRESVALYVGCIAGASTKDKYTHYLASAGFDNVIIVDTNSDLNVYADMAKETADAENGHAVKCCGQATQGNNNEKSKETECCYTTSMETQLADIDVNEWAGSFKIFAVKP